MPHTRSVCIAVFVGAGSRYESDEIAGASHFLEHLLFKGTRRWPTAKELSEAIEGVGGVMNGSTDREMTVFWCKVARPHFQRALSVISDMLLNPLLDPEEMEKERQVIIEELNMTNDYPHYRVDLLLDETMWPNQPLGRDTAGTKESVSSITREVLVDFLGHQYTPSNAVVSVAGDISHSEVVELVGQAFQEWKPGTPIPWYPVQDGQEGPRLKVEQRKTDQAHLCIGLPGLPVLHPDRYALDLMSVVLGEGMSSRLFVELRERQGLVYDVHSAVSHFRDCGSLVVYCGVEPRKAYQAVGSILEELGRLRDGIQERELEKARELAKGRLLLRMEDTRGVALWMGVQELLLGRVYTVDEVVGRIEAVSVEEIGRVARSILLPERLNLAVVGPYRSDRRFRALLKL